MKTILVVDDEHEIAEAIRAILEDEGYRVQSCRDGQEAVDLLGSGVSPDLVLSDVMMPRLGGFDLLAFVRGRPALKELPVVLMSSISPGVKQSDARWTAFLKKPFKLDDLIAMVKRHSR